MLSDFYKYLVDDLLYEYFNSNPIVEGSKFCIVIDDEEYRQGLFDAIKNSSHSTEFVWEMQPEFEDDKQHIAPYKTYLFKPNVNGLGLIIGYAGDHSKNSECVDEDFLNSLRNELSNENGSNNQNGVLYILSRNHIESLSSTGYNLDGYNMAFNPYYIKENLRKKVNSVIHQKFERDYINYYLKNIDEDIDTGNFKLFDFENILSIVKNGSLKDSYDLLDFFDDSSIVDNGIEFTIKEKNQRIISNRESFEKIKDIIDNNDDSKSRKEELLKSYKDSFVNRILSDSENWKKFTLDEVEKGKKEDVALTLIDGEPIIEGGTDAILIKNYQPDNKAQSKSSSYYVVCSPTLCKPRIRIKFSQRIKYSDVNCHSSFQVEGKILWLSPNEKINYCSVGDNSNIHHFYYVVLPVKGSFFNDINNIFRINYKKKSFIVDVPDDDEYVILGGGDSPVAPSASYVEWNDSCILKVGTNLQDENGIFNQKIKFVNDLHFEFTFDFGTKECAKAEPTDLFIAIWSKHLICHNLNRNNGAEADFCKIKAGDIDYKIPDNMKSFFLLEDQFVKSGCFSLSKINHLNNEDQREIYSPKNFVIPENIKIALSNLFIYFTANNTIPSLCYVNDELEKLYEAYLYEINTSLKSIKTEDADTLTVELYNISRLGTVERDDVVMLSPFHPIMVAYILEFKKNFDSRNLTSDSNILDLVKPLYLLPFIHYNGINMRPYESDENTNIRTWLLYEDVKSDHQIHSTKIVVKMVESKIKQYIESFSFLFNEPESPIIINVIGVKNDKNVIEGILRYLNSKKNPQRIIMHMYVPNILKETFYEQLNRSTISECIKAFKGSRTIDEQKLTKLFTYLTFYKHDLSTAMNEMNYCHITFYQMMTDYDNTYSVTKYIKPQTNTFRSELAMNGLISIPSTYSKTSLSGYNYLIGFGTDGSALNNNLEETAKSMNSLYANVANGEFEAYVKNTCWSKQFTLNDDSNNLLSKILELSSWVTFLYPEVDLDFFYKRPDFFIVHYTDQYTVNSKYDSITVTSRIEQYKNILKGTYKKLFLDDKKFEIFNSNMLSYFNCLNGDWLLEIVNNKKNDNDVEIETHETNEYKVREKMSLVASCILMPYLLQRTESIIWIPISLENILRVTNSTGLPQDYIFTKDQLNEKGRMSDDILMLGLNIQDTNNIKFYFYPVEVKYIGSNVESQIAKAEQQVIKTYRLLRDNIINNEGFVRNVFATFFMSQFLTNLEKFKANGIFKDDVLYDNVQAVRSKLLNLNYTIMRALPEEKLGSAAVIVFTESQNDLVLKDVSFDEDQSMDLIPVCHVILKEKACLESVVSLSDEIKSFLEKEPIDDERDNSIIINKEHNNSDKNEVIKIDDVNTHDSDDDQIQDSSSEGNDSETVNSDNNNLTSNSESHDQITINLNANLQTTIHKGIRILIGYDQYSNLPIYFEPNNTNKLTHPNMGVIGTMGTGKTQFSESLIAQIQEESVNNVGGKPIGVLVFDYKGDYVQPRFMTKVGATCHAVNLPFNPLKPIQSETIYGNMPVLMNTADTIADSLQKAMGLGPVQKNNISDIILETYDDFGITDDPVTWNKTLPTMHDVIVKYMDTYDKNDKAFALLKKLDKYNIFDKDSTKCISLFEWLNKIRIIDLHVFPDETKGVVVSLILDLFYSEMKKLGETKTQDEFREWRAFILVDEASDFMNKDFNSLRRICTEGRAFGVGMILSTQTLTDFHQGKENYAQFMNSWVIHKVLALTKSDASLVFNPSDENFTNYMYKAQNFKKLHCITKIGNRISEALDYPFYVWALDDSEKKNEEMMKIRNIK